MDPGQTIDFARGCPSAMRLWEVATGEELLVGKGHGEGETGGYVRGVAFSADGKHVVSGGWGGRLLQWDVPETTSPP